MRRCGGAIMVERRLLLDIIPDNIHSDAGPAGYPEGAFYDGIHLNAHGPRLFSAEMASMVSRCLVERTSAVRWWTLPAYRDRALAVPLEALVQSHFVLMRLGANSTHVG